MGTEGLKIKSMKPLHHIIPKSRHLNSVLGSRAAIRKGADSTLDAILSQVMGSTNISHTNSSNKEMLFMAKTNSNLSSHHFGRNKSLQSK